MAFFDKKSVNYDSLNKLNNEVKKELIHANSFHLKLKHIFWGYKKINTSFIVRLSEINHALNKLSIVNADLINNKDIHEVIHRIFSEFDSMVLLIKQKKKTKSLNIDNDIKHESKECFNKLKQRFSEVRSNTEQSAELAKCIACFSVILNAMEDMQEQMKSV